MNVSNSNSLSSALIKKAISTKDKEKALKQGGSRIHKSELELIANNKKLNGFIQPIILLDLDQKASSYELIQRLRKDDVYPYIPNIDSQGYLQWSDKDNGQIKWGTLSKEVSAFLRELTEKVSKELSCSFNFSKESGLQLSLSNKGLEGLDVSKVYDLVVGKNLEYTFKGSKQVTVEAKVVSEVAVEPKKAEVLLENEDSKKRVGIKPNVFPQRNKSKTVLDVCELADQNYEIRNFKKQIAKDFFDMSDSITKLGCTTENRSGCNDPKVSEELVNYRKK